jgi:LPXTG-motif cell wall-anchored protein
MLTIVALIQGTVIASAKDFDYSIIIDLGGTLDATVLSAEANMVITDANIPSITVMKRTKEEVAFTKENTSSGLLLNLKGGDSLGESDLIIKFDNISSAYKDVGGVKPENGSAMIVVPVVEDIDDDTGKGLNRGSSFVKFTFKDGYYFTATDKEGRYIKEGVLLISGENGDEKEVKIDNYYGYVNNGTFSGMLEVSMEGHPASRVIANTEGVNFYNYSLVLADASAFSRYVDDNATISTNIIAEAVYDGIYDGSLIKSAGITLDLKQDSNSVKDGVLNLVPQRMYLLQDIVDTGEDSELPNYLKGTYTLDVTSPNLNLVVTPTSRSVEQGDNVFIVKVTPKNTLEILRQESGNTVAYNYTANEITKTGEGSVTYAIIPGAYYVVDNIDGQTYTFEIESNVSKTKLILGDGRLIKDGKEMNVSGKYGSPKTGDVLVTIITVLIIALGAGVGVFVYFYRKKKKLLETVE